MSSELHKKAIERITPEERDKMIRDLENLSPFPYTGLEKIGSENNNYKLTMDEKQIIENNKLIAEFMGYQHFPFDEAKREFVGNTPIDQCNGWRKPTNGHYKIEGWYLCRHHKELSYHFNWSWLMPVIDRIEKIEDVDYTELYSEVGNEKFYIFSIFLDTDTDTKNPSFRAASEKKAETIYFCVVDFINWYNNENKRK